MWTFVRINVYFVVVRVEKISKATIEIRIKV